MIVYLFICEMLYYGSSWQSQTETVPRKGIHTWLVAGPDFRGDTGHDWNSTQPCFPMLTPNEPALEEFYWMSIIDI